MDLYKKLVNSMRYFDKEKLLLLIAVESRKSGKNKVALSHIAFLAAAISGERQKLQPTCDHLTELIEQVNNLLNTHHDQNGDNLYEAENSKFVSELKKLDLVSNEFDVKYQSPRFLLYPFLRLVEMQHSTYAFNGKKAHNFLLRSFAILQYIDKKYIARLELGDNKNIQSNFGYFLAYVTYNKIINTEILFSINDLMINIGVNKNTLNKLLIDFSLSCTALKEKYQKNIYNPWHSRLSQPNIFRHKPIIQLSDKIYIAPSYAHFVMKISYLIVDNIYADKDQEGNLISASRYGDAITDYMKNIFLKRNPNFTYIDIDRYQKKGKKADFIIYGKKYMLIVEVKSKIGCPKAKTLNNSKLAADSIKKIIEDGGYPQCKNTFNYFKYQKNEFEFIKKLTPIFIIVVNDDIHTLSRLCYYLYHNNCLKVSVDGFLFEIMTLDDFEKLMLDFNDVDCFGEAILKHTNSLKPESTVPFSLYKKPKNISLPHLKEFDWEYSAYVTHHA